MQAGMGSKHCWGVQRRPAGHGWSAGHSSRQQQGRHARRKHPPGGGASCAISSPAAASHRRHAPASSQLNSTPSLWAGLKSTLRTALSEACHRLRRFMAGHSHTSIHPSSPPSASSRPSPLNDMPLMGPMPFVRFLKSPADQAGWAGKQNLEIRGQCTRRHNSPAGQHTARRYHSANSSSSAGHACCLLVPAPPRPSQATQQAAPCTPAALARPTLRQRQLGRLGAAGAGGLQIHALQAADAHAAHQGAARGVHEQAVGCILASVQLGYFLRLHAILTAQHHHPGRQGSAGRGSQRHQGLAGGTHQAGRAASEGGNSDSTRGKQQPPAPPAHLFSMPCPPPPHT